MPCTFLIFVSFVRVRNYVRVNSISSNAFNRESIVIMIDLAKFISKYRLFLIDKGLSLFLFFG